MKVDHEEYCAMRDERDVTALHARFKLGQCCGRSRRARRLVRMEWALYVLEIMAI